MNACRRILCLSVGSSYPVHLPCDKDTKTRLLKQCSNWWIKFSSLELSLISRGSRISPRSNWVNDLRDFSPISSGNLHCTNDSLITCQLYGMASVGGRRWPVNDCIYAILHFSVCLAIWSVGLNFCVLRERTDGRRVGWRLGADYNSRSTVSLVATKWGRRRRLSWVQLTCKRCEYVEREADCTRLAFFFFGCRFRRLHVDLQSAGRWIYMSLLHGFPFLLPWFPFLFWDS